MGFSESSVLAKVAFVLSIVAIVFLVFGFTTTYWITQDDSETISIVLAKQLYPAWKTRDDDQQTVIKILAEHISSSPPKSVLTLGLFESCYSQCESMEKRISGVVESPIWLDAIRAFEIIAFLVGIGLVVNLIVWIFVKNEIKILNVIALVLAFVAALCVFIGVIIVSAAARQAIEVFSYGWSFILTVVSGLIFVIAGILLVVDKVRTRAE